MDKKTDHHSFLVVALVGLFLAQTASAAEYYVRIDGADSCDGKTDRGAGAGSCAVRTIAKANQLAACGDTVRIRAGQFIEGQIQIANSCADGNVKKFIGAGPDFTIWIAGAVEVNNSACIPDATHAGVFKCPQPSGTGTTLSPSICLLQQYTTKVFFQDENGVKGDLVGPLCMTRNTIGAADVAAKEGNYFEDGSYYWVRPWNDRDPTKAGSEGAGLVAASSACKTEETAAVRITGANVSISDLQMITPCYTAVGIPVGGKKVTLQNVHAFGGIVWAFSGSEDITYKKLKVKNALRRPDNTGAVVGTTWDARSQCMSTSATRFTMEDVETYGCREGFGLSNGANNGTINGLFVHGSFNHGIKIIDSTTHDIVIRDALTYNNQEPLFIECPYNIRIENSTFPFNVPGGCVLIQGNPGGCANGTPKGISFYNNIIDCLLWHNYGGDTWAKGGHKLDYNTYVSDNGRGFVVRNVAADRSMSLAAWQSWGGDPCTDCLRDPHSKVFTRNELYVHYLTQDDRLTANYDFDLRSDSPAAGTASMAWGDGVDMEGVNRSTPRDPGAYDHTEGGMPPCVPKSCSDFGYNCGTANDGCGDTLNCGTCITPQVCGASAPNVCSLCTPKSCAQLGYNCGTANDGCGGTLNCGSCTAPQTCGGDGTNRCGSAPCTPKTCAQLGLTCGTVSDGCSILLHCGSCGTDLDPALDFGIPDITVSGGCRATGDLTASFLFLGMAALGLFLRKKKRPAV